MSCYRNRDKLQSDGLLGSYTDLTFTLLSAKEKPTFLKPIIVKGNDTEMSASDSTNFEHKFELY